MSVSVRSNVPGYQEAKCFVSEGDSNQLLEEFVEYLVSISTKSFALLCEQFTPVFEALKQESVSNHDATVEEQLAQTLVDIQDESEGEESKDESQGINLMASDEKIKYQTFCCISTVIRHPLNGT